MLKANFLHYGPAVEVHHWLVQTETARKRFVQKILLATNTLLTPVQQDWHHRLRGSAALLSPRRQFPMGKMETLNPCKIETLEQIDIQFVRIDYVHERNVCSKFGKNPFSGNIWATAKG